MSSNTEYKAQASPPSLYNFSNWNDFWRSALRYHRATKPGNDLVIDRINTLRHFMSAGAQEHLAGLMKPHPRYSTTEGWDEWILKATEVLRSKDKTIGPATTANQCIALFKKGRWSASGLWEGLDSLVVYEDISSEQQRRLFWDAHSAEAQKVLEKQSPYFNPSHKVWKSADPGVSKRAEQKLAHIMEIVAWDEKVARAERPMPILAACGGLFLMLDMALLIAGIVTFSGWVWIFFFISVVATCATAILAYCFGNELRAVQNKRTDYLSRTTA